jgi:hypothetical protein
MGAQRISDHQLVGDLDRQIRAEASSRVDARELVPLGFRRSCLFATLPRQVGLLAVCLRTHRDVFAGRHGEGAGRQTGEGGEQDPRVGGLGRGDTHDQTAGGDEAVIGSERGGAQPARSRGAV